MTKLAAFFCNKCKRLYAIGPYHQDGVIWDERSHVNGMRHNDEEITIIKL